MYQSGNRTANSPTGEEKTAISRATGQQIARPEKKKEPSVGQQESKQPDWRRKSSHQSDNKRANSPTGEEKGAISRATGQQAARLEREKEPSVGQQESQ